MDPEYCFGETESSNAFALLFSSLDAVLLKGLKVYGGHYKLDENDDPEIFTVIVMGAGLKQAKKLYRSVKDNRLIMCMLADRRPIFQSNIVFRIEGFDYYGEFDDNRILKGGDKSGEYKHIPYAKFEAADDNDLTIALAPDKFKGTIDQFTAVRILKAACRKVLPGARVIGIPVADGGDGTAEILCRANRGKRCRLTVCGPFGDPVEAEYCIINRDTAVIEMASASGIALTENNSPENRNDPLKATSSGTGELIADALKKKIRHILIGLGGSATNDGGMGAAAALGIKFLDENGNELEGCGANMELVRSIDMSCMNSRLREIDITVICDVNNPMTGNNGATYVFGPQKGADDVQLKQLEAGMKNLELLYNSFAGSDVCSLPGAGAAGGMGGMLAAMPGATLVNGSEAVLDAIKFDEHIEDADIVITGEGRLDSTSMQGKAVGEVLRRSKKAGKRAIVIAGCFGSGYEDAFSAGAEAVMSTVPDGVLPSDLSTDAEQRLRMTAETVFADIVMN